MANEFRNLIFEGGGVKGIAYGGALLELQRMGVLPKIKRAAGTSAGAITAALLAVGHSADEICQILAATHFKDFTDDDAGFLRDIFRLIRRYGWYKGDAVREWIGACIARKSGSADLSFGELSALSASEKRFRALYIIGTNLSGQVAEVYSHETEPQMPIREAVRISMSIPLFYQAMLRKDQVLVDGGVTRNYPINLFDWRRYVEQSANAEPIGYRPEADYVFNHETLGFRLDSKDEIRYNRLGWRNVPAEIRNIKDYAFALASFIQEAVNKAHIHRNDWNRTVFIDTLGIKTTDFDLTREEIEGLIQSGREGVAGHFAWRTSPQGLDKP